MRGRTRLVALAAGIVALGAGGAALAHEVVEIGEHGRLVANRVAVVIPLTVECSPDAGMASVSVNVSQRSGNEVAQGYGYSEGLTCDDTPQALEVGVPASNHPFQEGAAFVQATLSTCGAERCGNASASRVVRFVQE